MLSDKISLNSEGGITF